MRNYFKIYKQKYKIYARSALVKYRTHMHKIRAMENQAQALLLHAITLSKGSAGWLLDGDVVDG